jgi:hypothetical protein
VDTGAVRAGVGDGDGAAGDVERELRDALVGENYAELLVRAADLIEGYREAMQTLIGERDAWRNRASIEAAKARDVARMSNAFNRKGRH